MADHDEQLDMFRAASPAPLRNVPPEHLARGSDPAESVLGALHIQKKLGDEQRRALGFVQLYPGRSKSELSSLAGDRDVQRIGRRLNEIEKAGLVRRGDRKRCRITGMTVATWWPAN